MDMLKHPGMADMPELLEKLDALRGEGKKIVFTNGCYDILHPGHVDLLERCKAFSGSGGSFGSTGCFPFFPKPHCLFRAKRFLPIKSRKEPLFKGPSPVSSCQLSTISEKNVFTENCISG